MFVKKIISWFGQTNYSQAFIMGGFLGIGFIFPAWWWLAFVAIIWMVSALETSVPTRKLMGLFALAWGIKSLCSIVWFWSAYPIDWVEGLSVGVQLTLISVYWITSGLWLSSGGALFGFLSRCILRQSSISRAWALGLIPVVWLLSEISAAVVFSFFTAGPGSFLQAYFSFGMIGYLLATTPFGVWAAAVGQVYGLTILMVGISIFLYIIKKNISTIRFAGVAITLVILVSFVSFPLSEQGNTTQTVIVVDTRFDPQMLSTEFGYEVKFDTLQTAVDAAVAQSADVVLLPEDSRYLYGKFIDANSEQVMAYWQFAHPDSRAVVIDSGRYTTQSGETVLRASVLDPKNNVVWEFDKQYLVPQGEYVPTAYGAVLRVLGYGRVVDAVAADSSYIPGPLSQTAKLPSHIPGVLFCFESVNPLGVTTLGHARTLPFIAHPISHGWFHEPTILWQQLDVMLQVQARFNGLPIVSAGNMVAGKMYLPSGKIETGEVIETGERYTLRRFTF
jgi:apolipoprotein N-acyltransferase